MARHIPIPDDLPAGTTMVFPPSLNPNARLIEVKDFARNNLFHYMTIANNERKRFPSMTTISEYYPDYPFLLISSIHTQIFFLRS